MSWCENFRINPKADLTLCEQVELALVPGAIPQGPTAQLLGARDAAIALATHLSVDRGHEEISIAASGHTHSDGDGPSFITVSAYVVEILRDEE